MLARLHPLMASSAAVQIKLNQVVQIIGDAMASEVCSIYVLRDGVLELIATRGLNQSAVHVTRLALGEGLVGTIAKNIETLNLDEATIHPEFAFKPETGEDIFHSFAGVPIVRNGEALGVLCVQHIESRNYEELEIEALQTVAMVLSELISSSKLIEVSGAPSLGAQGKASLRLQGMKLVDGLARGVAVYHQPRITIEHTVAEDIEYERKRVYSAFDKMRAHIDKISSQAEFGSEGEHKEVLETYKMFAYDEGWSRRINEAIDSGLTAEAAIERVQQRTRQRMRQISDPLLADRMHDLEDLSNRLLRIVSGKLGTAAQAGLNKDTILIARNLGPAELLEYDKQWLKGVVLEEGSLTSHVVIVARAMGIPVLGRVKDVRISIHDGDTLLLDCGEGAVQVRPSPVLESAFCTKLTNTQERRAQLAALRHMEPITQDGRRITLMMNAGLRDDMAMLELTGADGVGLFRTEFQFLISATLPARERQARLYKAVLDKAGERPVVFRTIDIGGDKILPYLRNESGEEENPAMGWRAIRLSLERGGLMKVQARALLEAAAGRTLHVMFPMVSEVWEFEAARDLFEIQRKALVRAGKPVAAHIHYGCMLEVPALAEMLEELLPQIDFLSIGTNDLTQFLFAADRANPKIAERYDWLSPAILRFLARIVAPCKGHGVALTVCGEMGGRPIDALALLGLGIERLSITPMGVAPMKAMVRSLDLAQLQADMQVMLRQPLKSLRAPLTTWAKAHGVDFVE